MRHEKRECVSRILLQLECHTEMTVAESSIPLDAGHIETDGLPPVRFVSKLLPMLCVDEKNRRWRKIHSLLKCLYNWRPRS